MKNDDIKEIETIIILKKSIEILTRENYDLKKIVKDNNILKNKLELIEKENKELKKIVKDSNILKNKLELREKENKELKKDLIKSENGKQELKNYIIKTENEKQELDTKINILIKKIKDLENVLFEIKKNNSNNNNFHSSNKIILELLEKLNIKEKEIKEIKDIIPFNLKKEEKLMTIIFFSTDQKIHYSLICKNTDYFINLEKKLFQHYTDCQEEIYFFMVKGSKINRFKTIEQLKIENSEIITVTPYEFE